MPGESLGRRCKIELDPPKAPGRQIEGKGAHDPSGKPHQPIEDRKEEYGPQRVERLLGTNAGSEVLQDRRPDSYDGKESGESQTDSEANRREHLAAGKDADVS
jgi:hypothetical protein